MANKKSESYSGIQCVCHRCDYSWRSRIAAKPKACPGCKSYTWDKAVDEKTFKENEKQK